VVVVVGAVGIRLAVVGVWVVCAVVGRQVTVAREMRVKTRVCGAQRSGNRTMREANREPRAT